MHTRMCTRGARALKPRDHPDVVLQDPSTRVDMCIDMSIDMCICMSIDMCIEMCYRHGVDMV